MRAAARVEKSVFVAIGTAALIFLIVPMLVLAVSSLNPGQFFTFPPKSLSLYWFEQVLDNSSWRSAIGFTLVIASLTGVVSTIVGGAAGLAIARMAPRWRRAFYPLVVAPLVVPVIVLAIAFYALALQTHLVGNVVAFVAADTLLNSPLVALLVVGGALGLDPQLELASLSCGAGRVRTLFRVTFPLIAPIALAGGMLAFLFSLDEIVMSEFLVAPGRTPLAVQMFFQVQTGNPPIVEAAATLLMLASVFVMGVLTLMRMFFSSRGHTTVRPQMGLATQLDGIGPDGS